MKYVGNEISYHIGNTDKTEYLNNKTNSLSVINQNMGLYKQLPKNMVTGIIDNFKTTFNKQNFLNYLNPNTSYAELKDYSKSVIQTGVTAYGGYKLGEFAYNKISTIVTNNSNISSLDIDNDYTSSDKWGDTSVTNDTEQIKSVPNPNGKKGGLAHQQVIKDIQSDKSLSYDTEYQYSTPNGEKSSRFADVVEINNGKVVKIYQAGKINKNGTPVSREVRAINDIQNSQKYIENKVPIYFIPYNTADKSPIIYWPK